MTSDKAFQEKEYLREALQSQIEEKRAAIMNRTKRERAEDQLALQVIAHIK